MNEQARKWMERATAAGDRMATVIDHVTANNLNMTATEWCAAGQLFADLARLHLEAGAGVEVVKTPDDGKAVEEGARTIHVRSCSACGGDHGGLTAVPISEQARWLHVWTHATRCPETGISVFVAFDDEPPPKVDKPAPAAPAVKRFGKWENCMREEIRGRSAIHAYPDGSWSFWKDFFSNAATRRGRVPEVDPADPRPILDRARAAAEDAARAEFGACEFGCDSTP